ncbi:alpha/beta hydrolase, partial [uncultured Methylobacterium sp.]
MKTADCDILILPGLAGSEEDHWQARWASRLPTARIVVQDDWHAPEPEAWRRRIAEAV